MPFANCQIASLPRKGTIFCEPKKRQTHRLSIAGILLALFASCAVSDARAEPDFGAPSQGPGYCGSATISEAFAKLGVDADKTRAAVKLLNFQSDQRHGLNSLAELRSAARDAGLYAEAFRAKSKSLRLLADAGQLIVNVTGNRHFALIESVDADGVTLYIPELYFQHPRFRLEEFLETWDGVVLFLAPNVPDFQVVEKDLTVVAEDELERIFGGHNCCNVPAIRTRRTVGGHELYRNRTNGPGHSDEAPSEDGNSDDEKTSDPVVILSGNLTLSPQDLLIPTRGLPLGLTRYYNAQVVSEVDGWEPEPGSGSWVIEPDKSLGDEKNGVYSGQGDRTATDLRLRDFELDLDMRTVEPGRYHTWETAWVNFRYQAHPNDPRVPFNAYCVLIHKDGIVELSKITNGVKWVEENARGHFPYKVRPRKRYRPTDWNHIKIRAEGRRIRVCVNGDPVIDHTDNNRPLLNAGSIALESYFCHSHYDNVRITTTNGRPDPYTFDTDDNRFIFGYGWTHSYSLRINEHGNQLTLYRENNQKERYVATGAGRYVPIRAGVYSQLTKDTAGFSLRTKYGVHYRFDIDGTLQYVEDRNRNRTALKYGRANGDPRLTSITGPAGRTIQLEYGSNDMVSTTVDPAGNKILYGYDEQDHLVKVTDREGNETSYAYDQHAHNLIALTDPLGNTYRYGYGYNDRVIVQVDPLGNKTVFDYCWQDIFVINRFTPVRNISEGVWGYDKTHVYKYRFDEKGFLESVTYPEDETGHASAQAQNDENGNITHYWDRNGNATVLRYDDRGNAIQILDAKGTVTRVQYHRKYSFPTAVIVANSKGEVIQTTSLEYDDSGNLVKVTDAEGNVTKLEYDEHGQLVSATDPEGRTVGIEYDQYGRLATIIDALGDTTAFTCDILGRLVKMTDAKQNSTTFEYNKNGKLKWACDPLGNKTAYSYTKNGDLASMTDPVGNVTRFAYDCFGNVTAITDAKGNTTKFTYRTANQLHLGVSNLLRIVDANRNPMTYQYDHLDRLRLVTDAAGHTYRLEYDKQGNLIKRTDPSGQVTEYGYDRLNRLIKIRYPDGAGLRRWYDAVGNLVAVRNATETSWFEYDELGRPTSRIYADGTRVGYTYDKSGRRTSMSITGFGKVTYDYDALGRLRRMTLPEGGQFDFAYDELSRRTELKYPNGTRATYAYDDASRLTELVNFGKDGKPMSRFGYSYDEASRRTRVDWINGHADYEYDVLGQLIRESGILAGKEFFAEFEYDELGNRLSRKEPEGTTEYAYNKLNQLTRLTRPGGETVELHYDRRGNLITKELGGRVEDYGYDSSNRVTSFDAPHRTVRSSYSYDGLGQRTHKRVNGNTTRYYYDLDEVAIEKRGQESVYYVHGPHVDEVLHDSFGRYYHQDALGSVANLSGANGEEILSYDYKAFGGLRDCERGLGNIWYFTGRQYDNEFALHYYRHRYYDHRVGRFITRDPLDAATDPNLYAYVRNSPANFVDPLGLSREKKEEDPDLLVYLFPREGKTHLFFEATIERTTAEELSLERVVIAKGTEVAVKAEGWVLIDTEKGHVDDFSGGITVTFQPGAQIVLVLPIGGISEINIGCVSKGEGFYSQGTVLTGPVAVTPGARGAIENKIVGALNNLFGM